MAQVKYFLKISCKSDENWRSSYIFCTKKPDFEKTAILFQNGWHRFKMADIIANFRVLGLIMQNYSIYCGFIIIISCLSTNMMLLIFFFIVCTLFGSIYWVLDSLSECLRKLEVEFARSLVVLQWHRNILHLGTKLLQFYYLQSHGATNIAPIIIVVVSFKGFAQLFVSLEVCQNMKLDFSAFVFVSRLKSNDIVLAHMP